MGVYRINAVFCGNFLTYLIYHHQTMLRYDSVMARNLLLSGHIFNFYIRNPKTL